MAETKTKAPVLEFDIPDGPASSAPALIRPERHQFEAPVAHHERAPDRQPTVMDIIDRASRDRTVDLDKLERLIALSDREKAQEAERAFSAAMAKAQAEMRAVAADANNTHTKSAYATYFALDKALRPIYTKHGFSLSFDTGDGAPDGYIRVLCHLSHSDGHSRIPRIDMPNDGKGAQGKDVMTKTHATGAAFTYGQRYLLKMIFNIAVGDDTDGNEHTDDDEPISTDQIQSLQDIIDRSGADIEKVCKFLKVEALKDIRQKDFAHAVSELNLYERNKVKK